MDAVMEKSIKAFPAKTQGVGGQDLAPRVLADGTKVFDVTASVVKWEVEPGKFVDAWTYNGTVPGPTIKVNSGDKVQVVLKNQLPESTSIHFHGLITPNAMDGTTYVTQPPVKSGETFTYSFTAQSTPAVGMYHSHHNAVHQVPDGLAGTILVGELPEARRRHRDPEAQHDGERRRRHRLRHQRQVVPRHRPGRGQAG